jgi:hypothetical protein
MLTFGTAAGPVRNKADLEGILSRHHRTTAAIIRSRLDGRALFGPGVVRKRLSCGIAALQILDSVLTVART